MLVELTCFTVETPISCWTLTVKRISAQHAGAAIFTLQTIAVAYCLLCSKGGETQASHVNVVCDYSGHHVRVTCNGAHGHPYVRSHTLRL